MHGGKGNKAWRIKIIVSALATKTGFPRSWCLYGHAVPTWCMLPATSSSHTQGEAQGKVHKPLNETVDTLVLKLWEKH